MNTPPPLPPPLPPLTFTETISPPPEPARVRCEEMPPTYMAWNLLLCIACFITGIIGLVFSSQVTQRWNAGDYEGARAASSNAALMLLASVVFGLINIPFLILYFAFT